MGKSIYLSTGAFTGRINGRNWHLAVDYAALLRADGFEFLVFEDVYPHLPDIIRAYTDAGLFIPVVHADKTVGDCLSTAGEASRQRADSLFAVNCETAVALGATAIVSHAWGYPDSDSDPGLILRNTEMLIHRAEQAKLKLHVEGVMCTHGDPLTLLEALHREYPDLSFTLDTRHAQFHRQLDAIVESDVFPSVGHLHINDYHGGYKEWEKRYPILQPGKGDVDWELFFKKIKKHAYGGTVTLEASAIQPQGVDTATLNKSLDYLRENL